MSIQRGELKVLIDLLERDPTGVNACDEVRKETIWVQLSSFPEQVSIFFTIGGAGILVCTQLSTRLWYLYTDWSDSAPLCLLSWAD